MEPAQRATNPAPTLNVLRVIAAVLCMSVVFYALIAVSGVLEKSVAANSSADETVLLFLKVMAIVGLGGAPLLARILAAQKRPDGGNSSNVMGMLFLRTIVTFAILDAVAILGLVIYMMSGSVTWCVGLCAAALMSMIIAWPKEPEAFN